MTAIFKANCNLFWIVLFLSGCAPVLSQAVVDNSNQNVLFGDLQRNTDRYIGNSVLFGGTIIRVGNDQDGSWIEILQRPLGFKMEPELNDQTGGRFLLLTHEILDEQIFSKGRKITVVGKVTGKESRLLDKITYDYPVLQVQEYHLWPLGSYRTGPDFRFSIGIFGSF